MIPAGSDRDIGAAYTRRPNTLPIYKGTTLAVAIQAALSVSSMNEGACGRLAATMAAVVIGKLA